MTNTLAHKMMALPMHGDFRFHSTNGYSGPENSKRPHVGLSTGVHDNRHLRAPRIVLYSHDTMGIGHVRRNLLLAQAIGTAFSEASILLISGAREASKFDVPQGIDFVTLPALSKNCHGVYGSRDLKLPLSELISIRRQTLEAAIWGFQPDLLIVDKVARGAEGELTAIIQKLAAAGSTKLVLGLRDILDTPESVAADWERDRSLDFISDVYDEVWIYGDRRICDPIQEYALPKSIADKTRFLGYLNQQPRLGVSSAEARCQLRGLMERPEKMVLCLLGGGQDGESLASSFAQARIPAGMHGVLVTGPYMPAEQRVKLSQRLEGRSNIDLLEFVPEADLLMQRADRVIAMGGYNTVCSILSFDKPALVVPRVFPRKEQQIRAHRLAEKNLLDVLLPSQLSPLALGEWISKPLSRRLPAASVVDLAGLDRIPDFVRQILQKKSTDEQRINPKAKRSTSNSSSFRT